ncbi:Poxvirus Late Transcription Factor VLTF3 like [uncultured virus]|nr:Poxvirus Late Transcription Factor VLTF3 like [uncultured virus]
MIEKNEETKIVIPKRVTVSFSDDYDIIFLDKLIVEKFRQEKACLGTHQANIETAKVHRRSATTIAAYKQYSLEIETLTAIVNDLTNGTKEKLYQEASGPLIMAYRSIPKSIKKFDIRSGIVLDVDSSSIAKRVEIINRYLAVAGKYIEIEVYHHVSDHTERQNDCEGCGRSMVEISVDSLGVRKCANCGRSQKVNQKSITVSREYDDLENLLKAFQRFIGGQKIKFSINQMIEDIDMYHEKLGKPTSQYYLSLPLNEKGRKDGTNTTIVFDALKATGYKDYYEDYMYICSRYFGWTLPDALCLQDMITSHYRETQAVWAGMDPLERERDSSLPTQYRLYKHLQLLRFPCDQAGFKLPQQIETIRKYDRIWEIMCDRCENSEIYFIPT